MSTNKERINEFGALPFFIGVFFLAGIFLLQSRPAAAQAETSTVEAVSQAEYRFGQMMAFTLAATAPVTISQATLFVSVPELAHTLTTPVEIEAGRQIEARHVLDLTQIRLAPFTTVTYWWLISDAAGHDIRIDPQQLEYADDQFAWRVVERENVAVYWTGDDPALGQAGLDLVHNVLPRMTTIIPLQATEPIRIYIYPSLADLRAALRLTGRDWAGAHARPELGVILVTAANPRTAIADLQQSIPHELSHLLLYQATGAEHEQVPLWFDEGLAAYFEPSPNPAYELILQEAVSAETTIPFADLCHAFPTREEEALLAYAQSLSLIEMIQAEYGNRALTQLVLAFADGADCHTAVQRVLGQSLAELNRSWLRSQQPRSAAGQFVQQNLIWLLLIAAGFGLTSLLLWPPPGKN